MRTHWVLNCVAVCALALGAAHQASGQNTADATLVLTITLDDVLLTDEVGNSSSATFENSTNPVGDLLFEDIGSGGGTTGGAASFSPPGSIGTHSASQITLLNGLDPEIDDIDNDSFDIGDSLVATLTTSASATTPGSRFFAQANSENILSFSSYLDPADKLTFLFSYTAELMGTLDNSYAPGVSLALSTDNTVDAHVDSPDVGPPYDFNVATDHFQFFPINFGDSVLPVSESTSGSFQVEFAPGDYGLSITFASSLVVNAEVEAVPEPSTLWLASLALLPWRRR